MPTSYANVFTPAAAQSAKAAEPAKAGYGKEQRRRRAELRAKIKACEDEMEACGAREVELDNEINSPERTFPCQSTNGRDSAPLRGFFLTRCIKAAQTPRFRRPCAKSHLLQKIIVRFAQNSPRGFSRSAELAVFSPKGEKCAFFYV